jgi:8-oxo-dGTP pyrophosphatase MutT (NUDIX family)
MSRTAHGVGAPRLTVARVQRALARPLPGAAAHAPMMPQPRPGESRLVPPDNCRQSGVMVLLYPRRDGLYFPLTRRSEGLAAHSGQVSLPGGGRHGDEPLEQTALRETYEELGVPPQAVEVIGRLSPLYVPVSNYCVHPYVGYVASPPRLQPNPHEVAAVQEVALTALLAPDNRGVEVHDEPGFVGGRRIPYLTLNGWRVWGATAMILNELALVLKVAG